MKSKLIAVFLALSFGSVLTTGAGTLRHEPPYQAPQSLAISKHGTLSEIFDANGKSRFGKLTNNGFEVRYRSKGKSTLSSAVGDEKMTRLTEGDVKVDGQVAVVTTTTSDRALEITSYFILDEKRKTLIIRRNFKNISTGPVVLRDTREYVDPALMTGGQSESSQPYRISAKKRLQLTSRSFKWVSSQTSGGIYDCKIGDCPPPPPPCPTNCPEPCPTCPLPLFRPRLMIATHPLTGSLNKVTLKWNLVTLEPSSSRGTANNEISTMVFIKLHGGEESQLSRY